MVSSADAVATFGRDNVAHESRSHGVHASRCGGTAHGGGSVTPVSGQDAAPAAGVRERESAAHRCAPRQPAHQLFDALARARSAVAPMNAACIAGSH